MKFAKTIQEIEKSNLSLLSAAVDISTHDVKKYKSQNGSTYYVKFSGGIYGDEIDHNIHIIIEGIAYNVYSLWGLPVPEHTFFVVNKNKDAIGLASKEVMGKSSVLKDLLKQKSLDDAFLPSVLLANYDVTGTGPVGANIITSPDNGYYLIDPGGALHFRAQGKRKDFGEQPGELDTMRNPDYPAGTVFKRLTTKKLKEDLLPKFQKVSAENVIQSIDATISKASEKLSEFEDSTQANKIKSQLTNDMNIIKKTISKRYNNIIKSIENLE